MNDVSFLVLKIVLTVSLALITTYLIPYLHRKTSAEKWDEMCGAVSVAVKAAEQTLQGGAVKKDEVVDYMRIWLAEHNVKITAAQLDSLIESIVYEVKQEKNG